MEGRDVGELSDEDRAVLDLEARLWTRAGVKEDAIRMQFEWTPTQFYQRLNALLDREEALAAYPVMVGRLRRAREAQRQRRTDHA